MDRLRYPRAQRTTGVLFGCLGVLAGVVLARHQTVGLYAFLIVSIGTASVFATKRYWRTVALIVLCASAFGYWRGSQHAAAVHRYAAYYGQRVVVSGVAAEDSHYAYGSQLEVRLRDVVVQNETLHEALIGTIVVRGFGVPAIGQGSIVRAQGMLRPTKGSALASISYAKLETVARAPSWNVQLRRRIAVGLQSALPEPQASFATGLLLGQRSGLPEETETALRRVGLTHIISVSGYNLTILVLLVRRVMGGRSKYQTALFATSLLALFLLLTGGGASIVRASLVSMTSLACWYYGRTIRPMVLILLPAALTALWNPLYVWRDIGWYLSFLAFFGVLVLAPLVRERLWGAKEPKLLGSVLLETTAAQLMTVPLVMFIFGEVSSVSLLANLLVAPFVPLAMIASAVAGFCGLLLPEVAGWVGVPARIVLRYMLDVAAVASAPNWSLLRYSISGVGLVLSYGLILAIGVVLWRKRLTRHIDTRVLQQG